MTVVKHGLVQAVEERDDEAAWRTLARWAEATESEHEGRWIARRETRPVTDHGRPVGIGFGVMWTPDRAGLSFAEAFLSADVTESDTAWWL